MKNDMNEMSSNKSKWGFATHCTMLNVALGGLVLLGGGAGFSNIRGLATMVTYPSLYRQDQQASSVMADDFRRATALQSASDTQIVLRANLEGTTTTVTYTYDRAAGMVTRTDAHGSSTILKNVNSLSFTLLQRPSASGSFGTFVPADPSKARIIGCRWSCSRKITGAKLQTETVEVAPIVLRNHC